MRTIHIVLAALIASLSGSVACAQASPVEAQAAQTLDQLNCPAPDPASGLGLDLLTPRRDLILPQLDLSRLEAMRSRQQVDPSALCKYRDANLSLPAATSHRVIFFGDSITEGWLPAAPALFSGDVIDRGISGQNTSQMLLRFREDVLNLRPRIVHIMAGINDINTPAGTVLTKSNLTSMVELAQAHGIRVVLGAITPSSRFWSAPHVVPGPQIVELNRWMAEFADHKGVAFVDYYAPLHDGHLGIKEELSNEGLHPNQRGYDIMTPLAQAAVAAALSR